MVENSSHVKLILEMAVLKENSDFKWMKGDAKYKFTTVLANARHPEYWIVHHMFEVEVKDETADKNCG